MSRILSNHKSLSFYNSSSTFSFLLRSSLIGYTIKRFKLICIEIMWSISNIAIAQWYWTPPYSHILAFWSTQEIPNSVICWTIQIAVCLCDDVRDIVRHGQNKMLVINIPQIFINPLKLWGEGSATGMCLYGICTPSIATNAPLWPRSSWSDSPLMDKQIEKAFDQRRNLKHAPNSYHTKTQLWDENNTNVT